VKSLSSFGGFFGAVAARSSGRRAQNRITVPLDQSLRQCRSAGSSAARAASSFHRPPGAIHELFLAVDNYQYGNLPVGPRHALGSTRCFWSAAMIVLSRCWTESRGQPGFYSA